MFKDVVVSVGLPSAILTGIDSRYAKEKTPRITGNGVFLGVRSEAVMKATERPLILASADWYLSAFAGDSLRLDSSIDFIIQGLMKRRKTLSPADVVMCLHFGDDGDESRFMEQTHRAGLRHAWVSNTRNSHPRLVRSHKRKNPDMSDLILVRRIV